MILQHSGLLSIHTSLEYFSVKIVVSLQNHLILQPPPPFRLLAYSYTYSNISLISTAWLHRFLIRLIWQEMSFISRLFDTLRRSGPI